MRRREFLTASLAAAAAETPNESIRKARNYALSLLKPSPKELGHGLELHANSVVIEPYGFSPRSAWDGDAVKAAVEAGASEAELQDLTEEMLMTRCVSDARERSEYMEAWRAAGITCIFQNAGEESQAPLVLIKRLARFTYVTDRMGGFVRRAVEPDDIPAAKRDGKHCLFFSANGVPLAQEWVSAEEELKYIRVFFQLGIRMMHLTYNRRNMLGDGCAETSNAGLSDLGRAAIAEMNRLGVIVDVAHSGWRTSLEAAKASKSPMVASHTACAALNQHIRAKPDEVIRAIVDSGGFAGICAIPDFIGGDIRAMLNHIDYVIKRFGADHAAIATDIAYQSRYANQEYAKVPRRRRQRSAFEYFWPSPIRNQPEASLSMAWTNWPLFTVGLVQRGHRDEVIQKVIGGNALRVARAVLPRRVV